MTVIAPFGAVAVLLAACASPSSPRDPVDTARYTPGVSYFGRNHYIEYIAGELPVILSAPHGGAAPGRNSRPHVRDDGDRSQRR